MFFSLGKSINPWIQFWLRYSRILGGHGLASSSGGDSFLILAIKRMIIITVVASVGDSLLRLAANDIAPVPQSSWIYVTFYKAFNRFPDFFFCNKTASSSDFTFIQMD